jgi:hypothetical protein
MNNPFDFFDAIFCINLDSRPDRWLECSAVFEEYGIKNKVQRFSASTLDLSGLSAKHLARAGCAHSHFSVAKKAIQEGYANYLVLEDDFQFRLDKNDFINQMSLSISQLPHDWDLFYLGCNLDQSYGIYPVDNFSDSLLKLNSAHCCHAMSFNKGFLERFVAEAPNEEHIMNWMAANQAIDIYLSSKVLPYINAFTTDPLLVVQRPSFSNIEGVAYDYSEWMIQNFQIFKANLKSKNNE